MGEAAIDLEPVTGSDSVPLTQELMAQMLGTRRSSVTVSAGMLHKA
jgi:hypothetical protein